MNHDNEDQARRCGTGYWLPPETLMWLLGLVGSNSQYGLTVPYTREEGWAAVLRAICMHSRRAMQSHPMIVQCNHEDVRPIAPRAVKDHVTSLRFEHDRNPLHYHELSQHCVMGKHLP